MPRDAVLASSIILSTYVRSLQVAGGQADFCRYELFDVVGESFGSHLGGVAFFLQPRRVYGDQCGRGTDTKSGRPFKPADRCFSTKHIGSPHQLRLSKVSALRT